MSTLMAPIATGAILAIAACSTTAAGSPRPVEPAPTSDSAGALDPCELLSDSDRAVLAVKNGEPKKLGDIKGCDWLKSGDYALSVALHSKRGFKNANLQGGIAASVKVGRHPAHQAENLGGGNGGCDIFIELTPTSMVQVSSVDSARRDTPKACTKALQLAQIIDPKLP
jgi:hypothetical protein